MANSMKDLLHEGHYNEIFAEFQSWHISAFVKQLNLNKNKGGVLPFVRGLRLSAQLIYAIRGIISEQPELDANWGHILDQNNNFLSRECDIIIHRKGEVHKWNGKHGCVMDFRFISYDRALAVVSCKSFVTNSVISKEAAYCKEMKNFVDKVWFFGECCAPKAVASLNKKAAAVGFDKFWHSYTWDKKTDAIQQNYPGWFDFREEVRKLK